MHNRDFRQGSQKQGQHTMVFLMPTDSKESHTKKSKNKHT
jgi:hypothetical protein